MLSAGLSFTVRVNKGRGSVSLRSVEIRVLGIHTGLFSHPEEKSRRPPNPGKVLRNQKRKIRRGSILFRINIAVDSLISAFARIARSWGSWLGDRVLA